MEIEGISKRFEELEVCVIIPTYNNHLTLAGVITDVLAYSSHIIVVNDGSTDNTEAIVKAFPQVQLISYSQNVGKGWALRQAFAYAMEKGYKYALTIDSDGQHFAKDIPAFLNKLEDVRDAIIIGSRNMDQAAVPGKSSFGHKFSNFWFWVETGIHCPDTQSGFRLYPLYLLEGMKFYTRKYEFEIEVIVRGVWRGVHMDSVPVTVYYAPKETRVSHFRPVTDFSRVGVLNAFLVVIAFVWIKPRDFFLNLLKKKGRKKILASLYNPNDSDETKALSIGFGIFMGIVPIWGFQLVVAIFLSIIFKLNKALVVFSAHISIPPMIPVILFLSYKAGEYWMGDRVDRITFGSKITFQTIGQHLEQYIYGSLTLAVVASLSVGLFTYALLKLLKKSPAAL